MQGITLTPLATALSNPLFTGRLLAASGHDNLGQGYVPIVEIPLDGSPARTLFDGRGRAPAMSPQGDRMIYTRYSSGTGEQGLELITVNGTIQPRLLTTLLGGRVLSEQDSGSFCRMATVSPSRPANRAASAATCSCSRCKPWAT